MRFWMNWRRRQMTNWMISSSVLILIVIGMRYLLKGKISARLQYALWLLVAVRLLVPVSFGNSALSVENITNQILPMQEDSVMQDMAQENMIVESVEEIHADQEFVANEGVPGADINNETTYIPTEGNTSETNIFFWIWLIGVVGTAGVFLITNSIFQRKAKKDRNALYVNWCKIPVYVSDEVETPCLAGVFSPVIYVTKEVAEDGRLLRHTVTHEMMHYKQGDSLWALIRCVCLALHWYNPLVWWAAILSKKDAEFSCDEATIKELGEEERKDYGKTLIQLSSREKYNVFLTATAMTSGKKSIKERIVLIAKKPKAKWYTLVVCLLISCVAVGCTFTQGKNQIGDMEPEQLQTEVLEDTEIYTGEQQEKTESSEPDYWMKPDKNKVCLAVMPDGVSTAGGDYRYIIPEDQTKWLDGYKQMRSLASGNGKWNSDERSMGVWIVFGEEWTCITDQGFLYNFEKRIEKSDAEDFYNLCMEEARKNGTGTPVRPEDIVNVTYAKIIVENNSYPIRDKEILKKLGTSLNSSTELRGGSGCPFTTQLYLELDNMESHVIYLASDTCSTWLSDGVYYEDEYNVITGIQDMVAASRLITDFTMAYFKNDIEALQTYMLPTSSVEVTGYSEGEMPPAFWTIDGLEGCIDNFKTIISVEFRVSEDADYFVYLEIPIRKQEGEWKVESYWLEQ